MSFGAKEARETRIKADRKPRVNLCGDCGDEISETELLCESCRRTGENRWEPIHDLSSLQTR
jgi:hypothetical protein